MPRAHDGWTSTMSPAAAIWFPSIRKAGLLMTCPLRVRARKARIGERKGASSRRGNAAGRGTDRRKQPDNFPKFPRPSVWAPLGNCAYGFARRLKLLRRPGLRHQVVGPQQGIERARIRPPAVEEG